MAGKWQDKSYSYKYVTVLGSTGSIGINTLKVINHLKDRYRVFGLSARKNIKLLRKQINQFNPVVVAVENRELCNMLKSEYRERKIKFLSGIDGIAELAGMRSDDIVVSAISGAVGLIPTLAAIRKGKRVALANKESMVIAGSLMLKEIKKHSAELIPVDSEHSAIFQSLLGHKPEDVHRLILTASGGPFLNLPISKLQDVTVKEALNHPHWEMGKKITIDSASLMNKGLEVIEAHWLFNIPVEKIVVQIHPQSIVHSMVEYIDGSIIGQMGIADMRIPISYALSFPERLNLDLPHLDLSRVGALTFSSPDPERFPCLKLAYQSIKIGETMPAILNAANEVAVNAFLEGMIKFTEVPIILQRVMEEHEVKPVRTIEDILRADQWARERAKTIIEGRK